LSLSRCAPEQDGWIVDVTPEAASNVEMENARAQMDAVELRLRLDPGRACVESLATRSGQFQAIEPKPPVGVGGGARAANGGPKPPPKPLTSVPARKGAPDERAIPMAVTEKMTGRRWGLACKVRR